jgi:endonuclease YncB( thermonuclease family)
MRRSPLALVLLVSTASAAPTTTIIAHVESVVDGDTVVATAYPWPPGETGG